MAHCILGEPAGRVFSAAGAERSVLKCFRASMGRDRQTLQCRGDLRLLRGAELPFPEAEVVLRENTHRALQK